MREEEGSVYTKVCNAVLFSSSWVVINVRHFSPTQKQTRGMEKESFRRLPFYLQLVWPPQVARSAMLSFVRASSQIGAILQRESRIISTQVHYIMRPQFINSIFWTLDRCRKWTEIICTKLSTTRWFSRPTSFAWMAACYLLFIQWSKANTYAEVFYYSFCFPIIGQWLQFPFSNFSYKPFFF